MKLAICIFAILLLAGIVEKFILYDVSSHPTTHYMSGGSYYEPKKEWHRKYR